MSIMHVMDLSWAGGILNYGIIDFDSNIGPIWAKNQCKLGKFVVSYFGPCKFGGKWRNGSEIPKFMGKFQVLNAFEMI
jgi:hypothetical protein